MARKARHPSLNVFINGRVVGLLRREPSGAVDFTYDDSWLNWPFALPVSLSLPLREDRYIGAPVIAVFDNLLPDKTAFGARLLSAFGRVVRMPSVCSARSAVTAWARSSSSPSTMSRSPWAPLKRRRFPIRR